VRFDAWGYRRPPGQRRPSPGLRIARTAAIDDRVAVAAIAYVLQTGCAWDALPESFPISRATAHRRFSEWVDRGVMQALHQAVLDIPTRSLDNSAT
jgi:transposase